MSSQAQSTEAPYSLMSLWSKLILYWPLLASLGLAALTTAALTILLGGRSTDNDPLSMNLFMGCFLILIALPKLANLKGFIAAFSKYDLVSHYFPVYAGFYPFLEILIGSSLLALSLLGSHYSALVPNVAVGAITGLTMTGVVRALKQKRQLACACFGSDRSIPLSRVALYENGAMFMMSIVMILMSVGHSMPMSTARMTFL